MPRVQGRSGDCAGSRHLHHEAGAKGGAVRGRRRARLRRTCAALVGKAEPNAQDDARACRRARPGHGSALWSGRDRAATTHRVRRGQAVLKIVADRALGGRLLAPDLARAAARANAVARAPERRVGPSRCAHGGGARTPSSAAPRAGRTHVAAHSSSIVLLPRPGGGSYCPCPPLKAAARTSSVCAAAGEEGTAAAAAGVMGTCLQTRRATRATRLLADHEAELLGREAVEPRPLGKAVRAVLGRARDLRAPQVGTRRHLRRDATGKEGVRGLQRAGARVLGRKRGRGSSCAGEVARPPPRPPPRVAGVHACAAHDGVQQPAEEAVRVVAPASKHHAAAVPLGRRVGVPARSRLVLEARARAELGDGACRPHARHSRARHGLRARRRGGGVAHARFSSPAGGM